MSECFREKPGSIPPSPGSNPARDIRDYIQEIARRMPEEPWSPPFKQQGPKEKVESDFCQAGWGVMGSQPEQPMHEQKRGQSARNQPKIVEPGVQKSDVNVGLAPPAVERI